MFIFEANTLYFSLFFKKIIKICRERQLCGYLAGSFMLGRFVRLQHPTSFWREMDADEIIVSSSTKFCSPACEMNGTPIGGKAPELVKLIQEKYMEKFENETAN